MSAGYLAVAWVVIALGALVTGQTGLYFYFPIGASLFFSGVQLIATAIKEGSK